MYKPYGCMKWLCLPIPTKKKEKLYNRILNGRTKKLFEYCQTKFDPFLTVAPLEQGIFYFVLVPCV